MDERTCTYVYTPPSSSQNAPSITRTYEERNCFQDYATRQIINLQDLEEKIDEIKTDAKFPKYNINFKKINENNVDLNDREFKTRQEVRQN